MLVYPIGASRQHSEATLDDGCVEKGGYELDSERLLEGYVGWGPCGLAATFFVGGVAAYYGVHRNSDSLRPRADLLDSVIVASVYAPVAYVIGAMVYLVRPDFSAGDAFVPPLIVLAAVHATLLFVDRQHGGFRSEASLTTLQRDAAHLDRVCSALNRITVDSLVEFSEQVCFDFYAGSDRSEDFISSEVTTTVTSDDAMVWRRLKSYSDEPPPEDMHQMEWSATPAKVSQPMDILPIKRTHAQVDAVVFFPEPLRKGDPLHWTYSHRWPGMFDNLRRTKSDEITLGVRCPTTKYEIVFRTPLKVLSAKLSPGGAGECTISHDQESTVRAEVKTPKEGKTYILSLEVE